MRTLLISTAGFLLAAGTAAALQPGDTMKAWKAAHSDERGALLDQLFGKSMGDAERKSMRNCLDEASDFSGHADLPIKEIAEACKSSKVRDDPV